MTHPGDRVSQVIGVRARRRHVARDLLRLGTTRASSSPCSSSLPLVGPLVTLVRLGAIETAALRAFAMGFGPLFVAVPLDAARAACGATWARTARATWS